MKKIVLFACALVWACVASAKVDLPDIFSDNMVLQQQSQVRLWGWADAKATVKVRASWGAEASAKADDKGYWSMQIATPAGSYKPQQLTFESGNTVRLNNVLIGEVWLASGQSNMEMPLGGFQNCPIKDGNRLLIGADAQRQKIHVVKIAHRQSYKPEDRAVGRWQCFSSANAMSVSAVGYYFSSTLNEALDVPIGLIDCSWSASRVECWMPREILSTYADIDLSEKAIEPLNEGLRPLVMYNAMLHPLEGYTLRGFIWYQGESNIGAANVYPDRLNTMVTHWRKSWGNMELPFYFVEIAPYSYGHPEQTAAALLREAQCKAQTLISHSGMVSTADLVAPYELENIHPSNKQPVGERLAFWALNQTYGRTSLACRNPQYNSVEFSDGKALVKFDNTGNGFDRMAGIEGFEICGADHVFHPAKVELKGTDKVEVSSAAVKTPVAVRYCFRNFQLGNLHNVYGLPVIPFRTDNF